MGVLFGTFIVFIKTTFWVTCTTIDRGHARNAWLPLWHAKNTLEKLYWYTFSRVWLVQVVFYSCAYRRSESVMRAAEMAPKCLWRPIVVEKKKRRWVEKWRLCGQKVQPKEVENRRRTKEKRKEKYGDVRSDRGGADRHLINTAQRPCYGNMYSTGCCTYRQTVLQ